MPYIEDWQREELEFRPATTPGELNYIFTKAINDYIDQCRMLNYNVINNVVGALEGAKLEFYRRVAAPYEDTKIEENGDVY